MSGPLRSASHKDHADLVARRERARAEAAETRALIERGMLPAVVDGILQRFPKVMARLAK